ncbi:MAG: hypothetical protein ACQKBU_11155 [Verrucomicrobiales bacterium]
MNFHRLLLFLLALALSSHQAAGQISVDLRFTKTSFLNGEPIPLTVSLTNLAGRDVVFQGTRESAWIDFIVNSTRGVPLTPLGTPAFGAVKIPAGKTVAKTVDLTQLFAFRELGNFSVYSVVRLPGQGNAGYQSRRHLFTVSSAAPYWSQVVGVPGKPGRTHEFRLIQFTGDRKNQLYAQVADHKTGQVIRTHHLGEVLMFRKPTVDIDSSLNMHVLYLITPTFWGHVRVDPAGNFLGRDLYKPSPTGDPRLAKNSQGAIVTVGGSFYDPKAEAERQAKERKASERPAFIYE